MKFNATYFIAGLEVVFAIVGMSFGWISSTAGSALILAGLGTFGARVSVNNQITGNVKGFW